MDSSKTLLLPKISVITVCLNAADKLETTIVSVLGQSYSNIEYIIVDGKSEDGTGNVLQKFESRVTRIVRELDAGIYDAMNKGIKWATGDLIIFLNAGDHFVSKDVLEIFCSKLAMEKADLFFGRIVWNDLNNKHIILSNHMSHRYHWDLLHSNLPHPATLYKKEVFFSIGLFDGTYKILGDYEWNARALVRHGMKFQIIDVIVSVFFVDGLSNNPGSKSVINREMSRIKDDYFSFTPFVKRVAQLVSNSKSNTFLRKIAGKYYHKKLNRIY